MGEKMDKAIGDFRKIFDEEMEAAKAHGKAVTKASKEEVKENGKVVKVLETTITTTVEEQELDSSPQVVELEKEITRLKRQVADQIGNIEALLKVRDKNEATINWLKSQVKRYANAAKCEKPRGSCRACKTRNCYHKTKGVGL